MHVLGPVSRSEARRLRVLDPTAIGRSEALDVTMLATRDGGHCTFHVRDDRSGGYLCVVHAEQGAKAKPQSCQRFPFRLVATPLGGRITTEHRCPCRTMGVRAPIDVRAVEPSLADPLGRLSADARVEGTLLASKGKRVAFARYVELERVMLARLAAGHDPIEVLGQAPFPALADVTWSDVGHLLRQRPDGTSCGEALAWVGDELLRQHGTAIRPIRGRPWSPAFEHAEARTPTPEEPAAMLADFVSDALFGLDWHGRAPFDVARAELSTRVALARALQGRFSALGTRDDRAMAEAIHAVELAGASALWGGVMKKIRLRG